MKTPRIGLALSGGGFRAVCFGLGCLRALHDRDLLRHVAVISGVSGGGLLAALYAYGPEGFAEFDSMVVCQLRRGLQVEVAARALRPDAAARNLLRAARALAARGDGQPVLRTANRTTALRDALASRVFGDRTVTETTHPGTATVITATDLRTTNAVRFGSLRSSCSAYGVIQEPVAVAEAVAASAAYPLLLPAMERMYTFRRSPDAVPERHAVLLTDGGVYDNLGLTVIQPDRSSRHTPHAYDIDYIVSCDAGPGRLRPVVGHFMPFRLKRSFDTVHRRAQDAYRKRLHDAASAGLIGGFVQAYLGMDDAHLPVPVAGLVPLHEVRDYATDLRAMRDQDIEILALRGEQLTRTLLSHYCPDL
jgi:predicted acylesterase/phospholipase RssA